MRFADRKGANKPVAETDFRMGSRRRDQRKNDAGNRVWTRSLKPRLMESKAARGEPKDGEGEKAERPDWSSKKHEPPPLAAEECCGLLLRRRRVVCVSAK